MGKDWQVGAALLGSSVVLVALVRFAGYFEYLQRHLRRPGRFTGPHCAALRSVLPNVPARLALATNEAQVWGLLAELAEDLGLARIEVRVLEGDGLVYRYGSASAGLRDDVDLVDASVTLGPDDGARASAAFWWARSKGALTPEVETLLVVLGDMIARALTNIGSPVSPRQPVVSSATATPERISLVQTAASAVTVSQE
jgi:hypothetical protein